MYLEHFELKRNPFQIMPDPDIVFLSKGHARAKAYMSYSVWRWDGFSIITGQPGMGKSLMVKHLISRLESNILATYINHTRLSSKEFLKSIAANFGISAFNSEKAELISIITDYLQQQSLKGKKVLLVIDEAQHLKFSALEELRFLMAIDHENKPLLNVILAGDDGLLEKFNEPGMEQLRQRVRLWYSLSNFDKTSVKEYINFRLALAGRDSRGIFTDAAISLIYSFTDGVPRLINILCDSAMIASYVKDDKIVTTEYVRTALDELRWDKFSGKKVLENRVKRLSTENQSTDIKHKKKSHPKLVISKDGLLMAELILDKDYVSIGSSDSNDLMFEDLSVCAQHSVINHLKGEYIIEDLDSLNGTYVNARKIKSRILKNGDIIGISSYQLQVSFAGESNVDSILHSDFDDTTIHKIGRLAG